MRKLIAIICLTAFIALQYGKIVSYWHCRLAAATVHCDCEKKWLDHTDKDHPTPVMIAKEKAEEVFLTHEVSLYQPAIITSNNKKQPLYCSLIPAGHTRSIFQPPRVYCSLLSIEHINVSQYR
jgi:hypothetical protein